MEVDNKREDTSEYDSNTERINAHCKREDSDDPNFVTEQPDTELSQEILFETIHSLVNSSAKRRKKRRTAKPIVRKKRKFDIHEDDYSGDVYVPRASSRCYVPYLFEVIKFIKGNPHFMKLVSNIGFANILQLDECYVPRAFVQWIADNTLPEEEVISIGNRIIKLSPESVVQSVGIPNGSLPVESDAKARKASFLAAFGLTDIPTITYFGNKILFEKNISDADFCRCFMVVLNSTFLCPNSSTRPSTQYLGAIVEVDKIKDRNWAKFVHEWLLEFIKKYLIKMNKKNSSYLTLGGCIYHLAVRCLDFTDFGPINLPKSLPRIHVWKGAMIKHFSDMTLGNDGKYGACSILHECDTCYAQDGITPQNLTSQPNVHATGSVHEVTNVMETEQQALADLNVIQMFHDQVGNIITNQRKQEISDAIDRGLKDVEASIKLKYVSVVLEVIKIQISNPRNSEETLKLTCSEENENSNNLSKNNDGEIQESDNKRCRQQSVKSQESEVHKDAYKDKEEVDQQVKELKETLVHILPSMPTVRVPGTITEVFQTTTTEGQGCTASSASLQHLMQNKCDIVSKDKIEPVEELKFNSTPDLNESLKDESDCMQKDDHTKPKEFSGFENISSDTKIEVDVCSKLTNENKYASEPMKKLLDCYSKCLLPDILVNVISDTGSTVGVVKQVSEDGTCSVLIESAGISDEVACVV